MNGGPLTVSHKDVTRYFMTKEEAVELILYASKLGKFNELFFLDMGKPIKILDLANKMIHLLGRNLNDSTSSKAINNQINIEYKGLEPGEKINEIVHLGELEKTEHPRIYISNVKKDKIIDKKIINNLINYIENDQLGLENFVKQNFSNIEDI